MKKVTFVDAAGDGEGPWTVLVDGEVVIESLHQGDMDVGDKHLIPLWMALGAEVEFRWSGK